MSEFFESMQPYEIASKITSEHSLTTDLVNHVLLIIHNKKEVENIGGLFARVCWNQWTWCDSEFNNLYRKDNIELNEEITPNVERKRTHNKYRKALEEYLETNYHKDPVDWFRKEIVKMTFQGMTYRQIQEETGINKDYIVQIKKQFKDDFRNYFNECGDSDDTKHTPDAEL